MSAPHGYRSSALLAGVAIVLLVGGLGRLLLVRTESGASAADAEASVLGVALASGGAAVAVIGWVIRRRRAARMPANAEQVDLAATTLAGLVHEQWTAEAQARALGDPEPMPVRWRLISAALMDHPAVIAPDTSLAFAGSSDRIEPLTAAFRSLPRRRLVIIGGPGTGKTTLAVQLLLELLAHSGPREPVPVMFSLVGWAPDTQPRVQDWLAMQLERTYPVLLAIAADAAAALVAQGRVLPILDGLDEVSPVRRAGILAALNSSLTGGVILTSRRAEYRRAIAEAGDVLTAAAAIGPLALTTTDAADYLRKNLPPDRATNTPAWERVLSDLPSGAAPNLAAVTVTPLGLWLIRTVYVEGRLDPIGLVDTTQPTSDALLDHLLDQLVPAVVRSRPPTGRRRRQRPDDPLRPARHHDPHDLQRWLTTIAEHVSATDDGDWHWWELAHYTFPTTRARLTVSLTVGLAVGIVLGTAVGSTIGRTSEVASVLPLGLLSGMTFGLGTALVVRRGLGRGPAIQPRHTTLRLKGRTAEVTGRLNRSLFLGLACVLAFGLAFGPGIGLAAGLTVGIGSALIQFAGSVDAARLVASPPHSYQGDRSAAVATVVVASLLMGLTVGMTVGSTFGPGVGLTLGATYGPAFGLAYGMANYAWPLFAVAVIWSATLRRLPWRAMPMLNDAYRLGLLHTVGPAYRFRHEQLQVHLRDLRPPLR